MAKKWYSKIFILQFLFALIAGKKQPKQARKMLENLKKFK